MAFPLRKEAFKNSSYFLSHLFGEFGELVKFLKGRLWAVIVENDKAVLLDNIKLVNIGKIKIGGVFKRPNYLIDISRYFSEVVTNCLNVKNLFLLLTLPL